MYFVIGWPQTLTNESSANVRSIVANSDQSLFLFVSSDALSLWYCRPAVQIVHYRRTAKSIQEYGEIVSAVWKSDSSKIVVRTTLDFLIFYQVVISDDSNTILQTVESSSKRHSTSNFELSHADELNQIPALFLELQRVVYVSQGITCLMSAEEELVISNKNNQLCGIEWNGHVDENFIINVSIPSNYHPLTTAKKDEPILLRDFKYSTSICGFSLVFSTGHGAFLPLNESTTNHPQVQLISQLDGAMCTAINHRYALIAFGLEASIGVLAGYDEIDRRFIISHRLVLPSNAYPEVDNFLGPINCLQWTPDSTVLATAWQNGGFALWTVFGSLLTCSLSWNYSLDIDSNRMQAGPYRVSSLAFGKEGFHLWMATKSCDLFSHDNKDRDASSGEQVPFNSVCKLSLAKSVLAANPSSSVSVETVLLASEDRMFVGGNKSSNLFAQHLKSEDARSGEEHALPSSGKQTKNGNAANDGTAGYLWCSEQESNAVDSFQWITVSLPQSYLESNWPVRLFAIDPHTSQNLAITGVNGLALYSLLNRRWRLFGNENHERDFFVTGGFLWFHDYIIAGCYSLVNDNFEIRAYSSREKLDNGNAKFLTIDNEVTQLALHRNRLLALCSNGSILLIDLHLFKPNGGAPLSPLDSAIELNFSTPIRVIVSNLELIPDCVTLCLLTDLHADMYHSSLFHHNHSTETSHHQRSQLIQTTAVARSYSILLNICGRVLLLEMDIDTTKLPLSSDDDDDDHDSDLMTHNSLETPSAVTFTRKSNGNLEPNTIKYRKVANLATNVENLWILPHDDAQLNAFVVRSSLEQHKSQQQHRPHLVTSLYLSCGAAGMAVWLSLEHSIRPLQPNGAKHYHPLRNHHNFHPLSSSSGGTDDHAYISKRIMLPIREIASNIYPLAIRFREAIVLGAESDFTHPNSFHLWSSSSGTFDSSLSIPFCLVKRTSQVYLHYILRELLRRNLGYRSWEIANTCTALPHFVHSLELLLHGVLEEEAASSQPIPDALLPRVVDFIRAFPVFLQTVIHCTRKTELALWPHLFSVVGSPKDLFQQCLLEGQLETAASYIIVLQNLEKPEVASRCASRLLQAARIAGSWVIVKELKRFLRATNYAEETESLSGGVAGLNSIDNSIECANNNGSHVTVTTNTEKATSPQPQSHFNASHPNCNNNFSDNGSNNTTMLINGRSTPTAGLSTTSDVDKVTTSMNKNSLSRSNSNEQPTSVGAGTEEASATTTTISSAKELSSTSVSQNHIKYAHGRTIPGAAIKQSSANEGVFSNNGYVDNVNPPSETNIVMTETIGDDETSSKTTDEDLSSLSNSDDQIEPSEDGEAKNNLSYNAHAGNGNRHHPNNNLIHHHHPSLNPNHHTTHRNGRAYPGSILRMNHDNHPNAPFQFLNTSSFVTVASSTSSISSFSSASSSAISSASVSPIVNKSRSSAIVVDSISVGRPDASGLPASYGSGGIPKMLKAIPIDARTDESQCVIS